MCQNYFSVLCFVLTNLNRIGYNHCLFVMCAGGIKLEKMEKYDDASSSTSESFANDSGFSGMPSTLAKSFLNSQSSNNVQSNAKRPRYVTLCCSLCRRGFKEWRRCLQYEFVTILIKHMLLFNCSVIFTLELF